MSVNYFKYIENIKLLCLNAKKNIFIINISFNEI